MLGERQLSLRFFCARFFCVGLLGISAPVLHNSFYSEYSEVIPVRTQNKGSFWVFIRSTPNKGLWVHLFVHLLLKQGIQGILDLLVSFFADQIVNLGRFDIFVTDQHLDIPDVYACL